MIRSASNKLIKAIFDCAAAEFRKVGWMQHKPNIFAVNLSGDAYGCVGLNKAIGRGDSALYINPVIGVGNQEVEKRIADLTAQKFQPYMTAAIGTNIGYLMPQASYVEWSYKEGDDCEPGIVELVAAIEEFGRPFMERNATPAALYETLLNSKRSEAPDPLDYRIAVVAELLGKHSEVDAFIDAKLREIEYRDDAAAEWFRGFAARLLKR